MELSISSIYEEVAACLWECNLGEATRSHRIALIKIKMPKNTAGYQIKSFIPIENVIVEKLRATKSNPNMFSQVSLKWI